MKNIKKIEQRAFLSKWAFFGSHKNDLLMQIWSTSDNSRKKTYIFTPNPEQLVEAEQNPLFAEALHSGDVLVPDGIGLVLASKLLHKKGLVKPVKERIAGVDVVAELLSLSAKEKLTVAIIGGRGYQQLLSRVYPQLNIVWNEAYQDVRRPTASEEAALLSWLKAERPAVIFVAFGAPMQEVWVAQHRVFLDQLKPRVVMVVGGSFDFLLGKVKRAPAWVQRLGLEWFYRLCRQPWRWRRQLRLLTFVKKVLEEYYSAS